MAKLLEDAIENYAIPPSSRSASDLVRRLVKLDIDDDVHRSRKQAVADAHKKIDFDSLDIREFMKALLQDKITLQKKRYE
jgi:Arc/MetJ-type ribon-helix-helix transcriptional regulator